MPVHSLCQVLLGFDSLSADGDDQVSADHDGSIAEVRALCAAPQAGPVGGASGDGLNDKQSVVGGQAQFVGQFGIDGDGANAERGSRRVQASPDR